MDHHQSQCIARQGPLTGVINAVTLGPILYDHDKWLDTFINCTRKQQTQSIYFTMLKSTFINSKRSQACISSGDKTYLSGKLEEEKYFGFPEEKRQTVNMFILVTC